jgi:hypothetical protein
VIITGVELINQTNVTNYSYWGAGREGLDLYGLVLYIAANVVTQQREGIDGCD